MKLPPRLLALERAARGRRLAAVLATAAPLAGAAVVLAWRLGDAPAGIGVAVLALAVVAVGAVRGVRGIDRAWMARRLDALVPDLEYSAELLYPATCREAGLAPLQRARVAQRLQARAVDVREPWPHQRIGHAWVVALAAVAAATWWPARAPMDAAPAQPLDPGLAAAPAATRIQSVRVAVAPPAYTGLAPRTEATLAARVEAGSRVRWQLRFDPAPTAAALVFHDGAELPLQAVDGAWSAERTIGAATLYRVRIEGAPPLARDDLHRLDAIADTPPELRVVAPEKTLTAVEPGQRRWELVFEAHDDYGLGEARLTVTLAKGSGEQVEVTERSYVLAGEGDPRARSYRRSLDLAALGIAAGDDAIARLTLRDNRVPQPNATRSPSLVLRWPAQEAGETTGLDGLVARALPAYFRSQRQIIIDTEALLAQRARLAHDELVDRSDAIGADQRILRLRYGQFLGEEAETYGGEVAGEEHDDGHGDEPPAAMGSPPDVLHEFGHAHDIAEAATLFDPQTRETLKAALAEMWQAELRLRIGEPQRALPFEYAALDYIKHLQQANRIYLSRVGLELPVVDEARRLTGDRSGARSRPGALAVAPQADAAVIAFWHALDGRGPLAWEGLDAWLRDNPSRLPDALGLFATLDALRRDPDCDDCRARAREALWPLLPVPPAAAGTRAAPDAAGRAWLDALGSTPR